MHNVQSTKKYLADVRGEMHISSNEEIANWTKDFVDTETAVARE